MSINNKIFNSWFALWSVHRSFFMHGIGHEYIYRYLLLLFLFGGLIGFFIGLMKDRRVRLRSILKKGSYQNAKHRQGTSTEPTLYFGNSNSLTFHLPECHRTKKLRNTTIFSIFPKRPLFDQDCFSDLLLFSNRFPILVFF